MSNYLILAFAILEAAVCFRIAGRFGRRRILWAALGGVFGIFALAALVLLPTRATRVAEGEPVAA